MGIARTSLRQLGIAIHKSEISFPSQVPVFACQSRVDIQWRVVELYFVHNWSRVELGERYGVAMERVRQLLSKCVRRAAVLGYLQDIPPFAAAMQNRTAHHTEHPPPMRSIDPTRLLGDLQAVGAAAAEFQ
jgi:hypothetical protein